MQTFSVAVTVELTKCTCTSPELSELTGTTAVVVPFVRLVGPSAFGSGAAKMLLTKVPSVGVSAIATLPAATLIGPEHWSRAR